MRIFGCGLRKIIVLLVLRQTSDRIMRRLLPEGNGAEYDDETYQRDLSAQRSFVHLGFEREHRSAWD
jgi:hypothetical protein